jgi:hypothetical protein
MKITLTLALGFYWIASGQQIASLSQSDIDNFLNRHNDARRTTNPQASNMLQLQWDSRLQNVAQNYASKCIYAHNPSRTSDANGAYSYVGENIYFSRGPNYLSTYAASSGAVDGWNSEKQIYNYNGNQCSPKQNDPFLWTCGHYTQNIWANTQNVGCGIAYCPNMQNLNCREFGKCTFVVCNYGQG